MDIAAKPTTADSAPELGDAAPTPAKPPLIRREDYTPYGWLVPTTRLEFELGIKSTQVTATLALERNPAAEPTQELRLNGDAISADKVLVDGAETADWSMDGSDLVLTLPGDAHSVSIITTIQPSENTTLMGLYASNGMLCTQCEAEGFRRITFFPDRPDVLSTYTVRMAGPKAAFPILLCNGNKVEEGNFCLLYTSDAADE